MGRWITGRSDGYENGGGSFNAVLRDYGRLGVLLANDGRIGGKQILPKDYLLEATDWRKRRFALLGVYGQSIFVDPELKLVLVITAVAHNAIAGKESLASERDALWRGLVGTFGKW